LADSAEPCGGADEEYSRRQLSWHLLAEPSQRSGAGQLLIFGPHFTCRTDAHNRASYPSYMRVLINFMHREGWSVHCLTEDAWTCIGRYINMREQATLIMLLSACDLNDLLLLPMEYR
jgi:hypothetical protein